MPPLTFGLVCPIEPIEAELKNQVEYDMDEQGQKTLRRVLSPCLLRQSAF